MKKIKNITMLLGALAFTTTACTHSENEPDYGEITLTTPVVTLQSVNAGISRTEGASNYSAMTLNVELLDQNGNETNREAEYTYSNSAWNCQNPLVVKEGAGNYYARAWALVNLTETTSIPAITGAVYATESQSQMQVEQQGNFTFEGENYVLKPRTAAIQVNLLDEDGQAINDISKYEITYNLERMTTYSWSDAEASETSNEENSHNGNYTAKSYDANTQILSITDKGETDAETDDVTYKVTTSEELVLTAGNFHTFNIKLGGDTDIKIATVTVNPFTPNNNEGKTDITIERN